jgi:HEAT repeats
VRRAAVLALGTIGGEYPRVGAPLVDVLQRDPDADIRACAAESLGKLGSAAGRAVPALAQALRETLEDGTDLQGFHGQMIAEALGEIGPPAEPAVPALIEALSTRHMRVPTAAATSLGQIGAGAKAAVGPLTDALAHEGKDYVNIQAKPLAEIATALADAGDATALPDLKRALEVMRKRPEVAAQSTGEVKDAVDALLIRRADATSQPDPK